MNVSRDCKYKYNEERVKQLEAELALSLLLGAWRKYNKLQRVKNDEAKD